MIARSKKAQITAFLIVGVAMVLIVVTLVFIRNFSVKKTIEKEIIEAKENEFSSQSIKNFVRECLFLVSKKSINSGKFDDLTEENLGSYVQNNIDNCIDFSLYEQQGYAFSTKENNVDVSINEDDVTFRMSYPLTITNPGNDGKIEIEDFFVKHKIIKVET